MNTEVDAARAGKKWSYDMGPTSDLHAELMGLLFSPFANITVFLLIYSYRKYWVWLHGIFFTFATAITLAITIPILTRVGLTSKKLQNRIHFVLGLICMIILGLNFCLGFLTKILTILNAKSKNILLVKRIHKISGYIVLLAFKANIYGKAKNYQVWVGIDAAFILVYVLTKVLFPKMEEKQISPKLKDDTVKEGMKKVKSVNQLDKSLEYIVFANNIYDIQPLRYNHPAGYQICEVLKNKEVDRYIYGSCVADELPDVRMWSHSYRSFTLMDTPVARLDITPTFEGLDAPEVECNIPKLQVISQKGNIFQINLTKKEGTPFTFLKYRDATQLGRYFGVTLNDKTTRLYTTVNFLVEENTHFLEAHLKLYKNWLKNQRECQSFLTQQGNTNTKALMQNTGNSSAMSKMSTSTGFFPNESLQIQIKTNEFIRTQRKSQIKADKSIPLMFKKYHKGKLTEELVNGPVKKLILSESKGEGLKLGQTKSGTILIVTGGTGVFPFCDLIDLLYKEQLMIFNPALREEIIELSPILQSDPFKMFNFQMLAAFRHAQDLHIITLEQLKYLAAKGRMKLTLKFKEDPSEKVQEGQNLHFTKKPFEQILTSRIKSANISKIWICGPPKMNIEVSKYIREKQRDPELYLII